MPRNLSANAQDYAGPIYWAAEITLADGSLHYFSEDAFTFLGKTYKANLRVPGPPRLVRSLIVDTADIEFLNADLAVSDLAKAQAFEGAKCTLSQLLIGIDEAIEILRGRLHEQREREEAVGFRLVSELDPAQRLATSRAYETSCTWRFRKPACGYNEAAMAFTLFLSDRTANIFSLTSIGDSTLAMTVNEHAGRIVVLTAGTGRGQKRLIESNTATTLVLRGRWFTKPDSTSKFRVYSFSNGAPKFLSTPTTAEPEGLATDAGARFVENSGLAMTVDEHKDELLRIISGTGAGQQRKIGSNTAVRITIAASEPDFNPAPDLTSGFRVLFAACPKDFSPSCEDRTQTHRFNGFPTLQQELRRAFIPPTGGGGGGTDDAGGGRGGGGRGGNGGGGDPEVLL